MDGFVGGDELRNRILCLPERDRQVALVSLQNENFQIAQKYKNCCLQCNLCNANQIAFTETFSGFLPPGFCVDGTDADGSKVCSLPQKKAFCICPIIVSHRRRLEENWNSHGVSRGISGPTFSDCLRECISIRILTHNKELFRASSTGKLVKIAFPKITEIPVYGVTDDVSKFLEELRGCEDNPNCLAVLLYPSESSVELTPLLAKQMVAARSAAYERCEKRVLPVKKFFIIGLDGTWQQAKRMVHVIPPSVERIHLSSEAMSRFFLRKQSQHARISTVEAIASCLMTLSKAFDADTLHSLAMKQLSEMLSWSLDILVRAVLSQTQKLSQLDKYVNRNHSVAFPGSGTSARESPTQVE